MISLSPNLTLKALSYGQFNWERQAKIVRELPFHLIAQVISMCWVRRRELWEHNLELMEQTTWLSLNLILKDTFYGPPNLGKRDKIVTAGISLIHVALFLLRDTRVGPWEL